CGRFSSSPWACISSSGASMLMKVNRLRNIKVKGVLPAGFLSRTSCLVRLLFCFGTATRTGIMGAHERVTENQSNCDHWWGSYGCQHGLSSGEARRERYSLAGRAALFRHGGYG